MPEEAGEAGWRRLESAIMTAWTSRLRSFSFLLVLVPAIVVIALFVWPRTDGEADRMCRRGSVFVAAHGSDAKSQAIRSIRQSGVEDEPPPGLRLLGLYQGAPLTRRGSYYCGVLPDKITIYRGPLLRL